MPTPSRLSAQAAGPAFPARVRRAWPAALVALAVAPLLPLLLRAGGVLVPDDDARPFSSTGALLTTAAHDGLALVVVAALVALLGGWRSVLLERPRVRSWPAVVALAGFAAVTLVRFATPVGAGSGDYLVALVALVLAVAAVEELTFRGAVVVGVRRALPEWAVWLISTAAFGLLHLVGPDDGGAYQLVTTLVVGSACYLARRVSGGLLAPVVLHALYDAFLGFRTQAVEAVPPLLNVAASGFLVLAAVLGLVVALRRPVASR